MTVIILVIGLVGALAYLAKSYVELRNRYTKLEAGYRKYMQKFSNVDLIYSTLFKDSFEKASNREELIEYFRSMMEHVYKRTTIGTKGDNTDLYTEQETIDAQTTSINRQIVRPWMPEIDELAGEYYEKYNSN